MSDSTSPRPALEDLRKLPDAAPAIPPRPLSRNEGKILAALSGRDGWTASQNYFCPGPLNSSTTRRK